MRPTFPILFEDNHLLVVNKPARLPTMGVADDKSSLLKLAKRYIGEKYRKPGNVYLGIVSRLDAPVTGVVLIARTSKAAKRLTEQFKAREVEKTYLAVVPGPITPERDRCVDWVRKEERHRKVMICRKGAPGSQEAVLDYKVVQNLGALVLLKVHLETGRKHQIRVQLASRGAPIIGDRKYGSQRKFPNGIALHARRLAFEHPVKRERIEFVADLPGAWDHLKLPGFDRD